MKQVSYTICALNDEMIHHDVFRAHACMTHRVHSIATCACTQTHSDTLTHTIEQLKRCRWYVYTIQSSAHNGQQ